MTLEELTRIHDAEKAAHAKTQADLQAAKTALEGAQSQQNGYRANVVRMLQGLHKADPRVAEYAIATIQGKAADWPLTPASAGGAPGAGDAGAPDEEVPAWAQRWMETQRGEVTGLRAILEKKFGEVSKLAPDLDALKVEHAIARVSGKYPEKWAKYEKAVREKLGDNPALMQDPDFIEFALHGVSAPDAEKSGYERAQAEAKAKQRALAGFGPMPTSRGSADLDLSKLGIEEWMDAVSQDPGLMRAEAERVFAGGPPAGVRG